MAKTKTKPETKTEAREQVIFEVIGIREDGREWVVDRFTVREVAEFRANGAKMFARVGDKTDYVVRPANLILDADIQAFLKRLR